MYLSLFVTCLFVSVNPPPMRKSHWAAMIPHRESTVKSFFENRPSAHEHWSCGPSQRATAPQRLCGAERKTRVRGVSNPRATRGQHPRVTRESYL